MCNLNRPVNAVLSLPVGVAAGEKFILRRFWGQEECHKDDMIVEPLPGGGTRSYPAPDTLYHDDRVGLLVYFVNVTDRTSPVDYHTFEETTSGAVKAVYRKVTIPERESPVVVREAGRFAALAM